MKRQHPRYARRAVADGAQATVPVTPHPTAHAAQRRHADAVAVERLIAPTLPSPANGTPLPPARPARAGFLLSFVYAAQGVAYAVRTQRNMRVHISLFILAVILGIVLHISPVEFAMVFVAATGVFVAEMLNTVTEACVDLVTQDYHALARIAKDVAAGAVLVNAVLSLVIALFVFGPHLWPLVLQIVRRP